MSKKLLLNTKKIPVVPLRGLTVFPFMTLPFDVGRAKSIRALEEAMDNDQMIMLVAQIDPSIDEPNKDDMFKVGTIARVKQMLRLPGENIRVLVEGLERGEILKFKQMDPYIIGEIATYEIEHDDDINFDKKEALSRLLVQKFEEYAAVSGRIPAEAIASLATIVNQDYLVDTVSAHLALKTELKQELLEEFDGQERMFKLLRILSSETEIVQIEREINDKVKAQMDKMQREYYLREQMKVIQSELGEQDGAQVEIDEYKKKIEQMDLPDEVLKKAEKELDRLAKTPPGSAEGGVIRTYLDWICDLPWNIKTEEHIDLTNAMKILDEDHYGLQKVKERIIEFLAIKMMQKDIKGTILCLVGPPGVGKTSIAKSIARAVNRKYVRMSLGGVRDEAEIRGHRRTYVGAMPGRIITAMKQASSANPLILMDEIDKMSSDFRGDPASALLEVLDGEQNNTFRDHYMEVPFDLSDVMFILTANSLDTIPRPLLDRMEILQLSSYTEEEKVQIAMRYLVPKQIRAHGLKKSMLKISEPAVRDMINYYTRESGVRNLERKIADVCRKAARIIIEGDKKSVSVSPKIIETMLGGKRFFYDSVKEKDEVGVATGLAWTSVGGDTLSIEVTLMPGNGKLELTGQLGDVMKESAMAAVSYIRSMTDILGIDPDFHNKYDIHIHVPEGATPKDGPSAGITLATALTSALTGKAVKRTVAMTGEITLRGRVLPIGGLKEKALAAHRAGITTVVIPIENKKDLEEIPDVVKQNIKFITAKNMNDVLGVALAE